MACETSVRFVADTSGKQQKRNMAGRSVWDRKLLTVYWILLVSVMGAVLAESSVNSSSIVSSSSSQDDPTVTTMEKGMKPFFDMVKTFLGVVQPEKITTQTWLSKYTQLCKEQCLLGLNAVRIAP